ncbi:uncharacterized protein M6B38_367935 [Iris pallida]|uniref:Chlororespiratory reduction 3 n=1 Tax=Iris pallida TaxID=29817 RepID=A0AAX6GEM0_IRIPA|nr:uncharacterized protein M6B38_367935 [Iris pallida]
MACFQIPTSGLSPLRCSAPARRRLAGPSVVRCHFQENDGAFDGEDPPESLFMRELRRRGMAPMVPLISTSMLEEVSRGLLELGLLEGMEIEVHIEKESLARMMRQMKGAAPGEEFDGGIAGERRELDCERLEGFIPRAKLLLTIGGTLFLGFGPLIMITIMFFAALYLNIGSV